MKHTSLSGRLYKRCERVEASTLDYIEKTSPRGSMSERGYVWHDGPTSKEVYYNQLNQIEALKGEFRL